MTVTVPAYSDLLWPTLQSAIALGGSASIAELDAAVIESEQLTPEQQSVLLSGGPQTVVQNRLAWARTYLKFMGHAKVTTTLSVYAHLYADDFADAMAALNAMETGPLYAENVVPLWG